MGNRLHILLALAAVLAAGCGDAGKGDVDSYTDADTAGRGTVTLEAEDPLVLNYRQETLVQGTYRDHAGSPAVTDLVVSLQGTAHDTTLSSTSISSGPDGMFSFTITAGTLETEFILRVVSMDGATDHVDVVIDIGNGAISLDATYAGRRSVQYHAVSLTDGTVSDCPALTGSSVHSSETDDATLPLEVTGLPEATELVLALSGGWCEVSGECEEWVHGCTESISLDGPEPLDVTITLEDDLGFFASPTFDVTLDMAAAASSATWLDALMAPLDDAVERTDDPARYLLDGIYERIVITFGTTQGDLFSGARTSADLDAAVDTRLAAEGLDMEALITTMRGQLSSLMSPLTLEGTLEGDFWNELDQRGVHQVDRMGNSAGYAETSHILEADPTAAEVQILYDRDIVTIEEYVLPVGLGETLMGLLEHVALPLMTGGEPGVPVTLEDHLEAEVDCSAVADELVADSTAASIAGATWYEEACNHVLGDLARTVWDEATALDSTHPGLVVEGSCDFLNSGGYAREDLSCEGSVTAASWGVDEVVGDHTLVLEMPSL